MIGFGEVVALMLETNKNERHKADSAWLKGICLGYIWRSTEYIVGTKDCVYKCRTVRRQAEELSYDPECADYLKITYCDFVLKEARSTSMISFPMGEVRRHRDRSRFVDASSCCAEYTRGPPTM